MERTEEDWSVECSDDEKYEVDPKVTVFFKHILFVCMQIVVFVIYSRLFINVICFCAKNGWIQKAEDIVSFIEGLESNNKVLKLEWKCPGRQEPSPVTMNNHQQDLMHEHYK